MISTFAQNVSQWFQGLQAEIIEGLEELDEQEKFQRDKWERAAGGGGLTCILQNGAVIEKGGVNFSAVHGPMPEKILNALKLEKSNFFATGVSIVLHPQNPLVPIIHMNVRYFEMDNGTWWFGGGIDLTPHYIFEEDARFFHEALKNTCDKTDTAYYPKFKKWADDYFYIPHRKETRGIGGIFFDRLSGSEEERKRHWNFVQNVGKTFLPTYLFLANKHKNDSFTKDQKLWQDLRRGRYVEFNLVYDKGTKFGLDTDGRIESILMSMPPEVKWQYNIVPKENSPEAKTQNFLKKEIDWV